MHTDNFKIHQNTKFFEQHFTCHNLTKAVNLSILLLLERFIKF
jgi:hypothetical protein